MSDVVEKLFTAALAARGHAHAPYSNFPVGAALITDDGAVHAGCNVEVASFPEGWCAETTAIGRMVSAGGGRKIRAVLVVAAGARPTAPCGGCRQRLAEFSDADTIVHIAGLEGVRESHTMGALLPVGFVLTEDMR